MSESSNDKRQSEHAPRAGVFFAEETPTHEKEMHPMTVISMLKDELRRSQEHIYELYRHIAELTKGENEDVS
jgi:hypothetical protein